MGPLTGDVGKDTVALLIEIHKELARIAGYLSRIAPAEEPKRGFPQGRGRKPQLPDDTLRK